MKMNGMKSFLTSAAVAVPLLVVPTNAQAADPAPVMQQAPQVGESWGEKLEGFQMSLKPEKKKYALGEAVHLTVTCKNVDRESAQLWQDPEHTYKLEILRPDGALAPLTSAGEKEKKPSRFMVGSFWTTKPGSKNEAQLRFMNLYFDMTQVGEYQLRVLRSVPKRPENMKDVKDKEATLYSNVIKIRMEAPKAKDDATTTAVIQEDAEATDDATQDEAATDETAAP